MKNSLKVCVIFFSLLILFAPIKSYSQNVTINGGWFYVDGKKFFIKGIGYETHTRPGQTPWNYSFDSTLIKFDLQRIKSAGFNTIRTWGAMKEEELRLVESSGLKMLFGIWIDPAGEFGNAAFISSVKLTVNEILSYSKKYKCIIGYLIMNEPQVDHIYQSGSQNLSSLWRDVKSIIEAGHPGIPVSFSNAVIGDFIDAKFFDYVSFNAYIYNPVTLSDSHGYKGYLKFLKDNRAASTPFVITEFGLSVSPGIPGAKYSYGGNSLEMQSNGNLLMYRGLIDAGAQGGCVFQYHDGWWKGGNEWTHENNAEEWFGLIEFLNASDKNGTLRPAWSAFATYNKAIITNPKNETIYTNQLPVEIFTTPDVASFSIKSNSIKLFEHTINDSYFNGSISLNYSEPLKDYDLVFDFFDNAGTILKSERISILSAMSEIKLPELLMTISPAYLSSGNKNYIQYKIRNNTQFKIENNKIDYVLHPHIGFDAGISRSRIIPETTGDFSFQDNFDVPQNSKVSTFGAGMTVKINNFTKRITAQDIFTSGDWADPIKAADVNLPTEIKEKNFYEKNTNISFQLAQNNPNPFNPITTISYELPAAGNVKIEIFNSIGQTVKVIENSFKSAGSHSVKWDGKNGTGFTVNSGIYFYRMSCAGSIIVKKMMLLK